MTITRPVEAGADLRARWTPTLDQPIRQLEEHAETLMAQQHMNFTSANIYFLYDAKLRHEFCELVRTMPEVEAQRACREQEDWLELRDREAAEAAAEFKGGSIAPLIRNSRATELTKQRLAEIAAYGTGE